VREGAPGPDVAAARGAGDPADRGRLRADTGGLGGGDTVSGPYRVRLRTEIGALPEPGPKGRGKPAGRRAVHLDGPQDPGAHADHPAVYGDRARGRRGRSAGRERRHHAEGAGRGETPGPAENLRRAVSRDGRGGLSPAAGTRGETLCNGQLYGGCAQLL